MGTRTVGFDALLSDLELFGGRGEKEFRGVVKRGAQNIKVDWRARWEAIQSHPTHIPHLPRGIGYDIDSAPDWHKAEIGVAAHNRQAPIAHLIEFGSIHNPPHPAGQDSLDAEEPRFASAMAKAIEKLLDGTSRE